MNKARMLATAVSMIALLLGVSLAAAQPQSGGQFCVRAFEDRNGNQTLDGGEPFLTRGIGAQLLDAGGIVVATALMDNSPTAAQGVICFTGLPFGQYTMLVSAPEFTRTTPESMTVSINPGELPTVFVFGAQRIAAPAASSASGERQITTPDRTALLERLLIALAGALVVVFIMLAMGVIIYLLAFRSRFQRAIPDMYISPRVTTGSHPAVRASDSSELPKA